MSDDPDLEDIEEVLISLVSAALTAAQADAAETGELIFRPEWEPTLRTRKSARTHQSSSWLRDFILSNLPAGLSEPLLPQQDQSHHPPPPAAPPASTPAPLPPAASPAPPSHPHPPQPEPQEDAVAKLLEDNREVFDRLIYHPFPRALGDGTASLDGFRYYMIQDTLYLETCARLKMSAVARSPNFNDVANFVPRHMSSLEYVKKSKEILTSMLGVPESIIDTTPRSKSLEASEKHYMASLRDEDAFFAYYIVLLPCVLSYWKIAERLMNDQSTARNVVYHPAWIEINHDRSSADKYIKFINANIMAKGNLERWNKVFKTACELEADLFNTGLQAPTPYQIVRNGTYSIQGSSAAKRVVLANQNVESFLRSPFDKHLGAYFPSDAGSSVVGVNGTGGDNEKWHVVVTKNGYTFQNVGTGHYLGIATELDRKEGRILQTVAKPYYWWINPIQSELTQGSLLYQIYESKNLRYTLHADIEVLKSVNHDGPTTFRHTPIISRENFKKTHQMWSFELGQPKQSDVVNATMHNKETRQEPLQEAPKENDKMDARKKEVAERMAKLVEKYARVLREELRKERNEEMRQEPRKGAQEDIDKMDAGNEVAKKMAKLVEKYMQMLRGEFEAVNQLRKECNERVRQELLKEARKDGTRGEVRMAKLFEKDEQMVQEEFEAAEQLRKERSEKMRQELLRGARKDTEKMVANEEVTKMAKLFEKYEQMMQEELEAIEQFRTERDEKMRQELLQEERKDFNSKNAITLGEATKKTAKRVERYERMLREDFEAVGQFRKERIDEMMQELLKEAREVIDKMVASMEADKKIAGKYERMLQEGFEAIEQMRKERNVELRQELLEEVRKGISKTDAREGAKKMAELAEKYEQRLQEEFEAIEQLRMVRNEETRQDLLKEARKAINKMDARREGAKKMAELFETYYEQILQEEFEAIEQLRKERNEMMRQELFKESRKGANASRRVAKMAELVEKYERLLLEDFEAIGQMRKECHEEARQKLLKEAKLRR